MSIRKTRNEFHCVLDMTDKRTLYIKHFILLSANLLKCIYDLLILRRRYEVILKFLHGSFCSLTTASEATTIIPLHIILNMMVISMHSFALLQDSSCLSVSSEATTVAQLVKGIALAPHWGGTSSTNCYSTSSQIEYMGTKNTDSQGRTCVAWTVVNLQTDADFPENDMAAASNYCRSYTKPFQSPKCYVNIGSNASPLYSDAYCDIVGVC